MAAASTTLTITTDAATQDSWSDEHCHTAATKQLEPNGNATTWVSYIVWSSTSLAAWHICKFWSSNTTVFDELHVIQYCCASTLTADSTTTTTT
jgi:DNA-directed RNA polymerase subunit N (RpoN/RPB10)